MTLLTIGYGNRGKQGFFSFLEELQVTHLVDVRTTPYSRYHHDFDRESLSSAIAGMEKLRYAYMGDTLGGEAAREGGSAYQIGLNFLYHKLHKEPNSSLCLMCGCLRAETCHRGTILGESFLMMGAEVLHLDESNRLISQPELRSRIAPVQLELTL